MYFGNLALPLNEDHQFLLPPAHRQAVSAGGYLTQGFDRNLLLLPASTFETLCARLASTSLSDPLARLLRRLLLAGAVQVSLDEAGAIQVPSQLCDYAGLERQVVAVGQGEYYELWSPALWEQQAAGMLDAAQNGHRFEKFNLPLG